MAPSARAATAPPTTPLTTAIAVENAKTGLRRSGAMPMFTAKDGTPRIAPTWFQWTNGELVMPTFIEAPHVRAPARPLAALRARPDVAVSIDTETTPAQVLLVRGQVQVTEVVGVDPDYAVSARQYLGEEAAGPYLAMADQPGTRMARITVRPRWVGLLDFAGGRLPGVMATPST